MTDKKDTSKKASKKASEKAEEDASVEEEAPVEEEASVVHLQALDTDEYVAACGAEGDNVVLNTYGAPVTCSECAERV